MRTVHFTYTNSLDLEIKLNSIQSQQVLVQIFSGVLEKKTVVHIVKKIRSLLPQSVIIGATTDGEICNARLQEKSVTISVTEFAKSTIIPFSSSLDTDAYQKGKEFGKRFHNAQCMILFASSPGIAIEDFFEGFAQEAKGIPVAGGVAGDNATFQGGYVFDAKQIVENGIVGVALISSTLSVVLNHKFGWVPFGRDFTITTAHSNRVYTIEHTKAIDFFKKYLGKDIISNIPSSSVEIPLLFFRPQGVVARVVLASYEDGSIALSGKVQEGERAYFGIGDIENIFQESHHLAITKDVETIFVYCCMARKHLLGKDVEMEFAPLNKIAPVSGFCTYGEFFSDTKPRVLNESCIFLGLKEGELHDVTAPSQPPQTRKYTKMLKAMIHLTNTMAQELRDFNKDLKERIENEVEKSRKKDVLLIQQSKLAQMGEMISMIAHQWRQPLNAISLEAMNLTLKAQLQDITQEDIVTSSTFIQNQCQKMSQTIETFINFAKGEKKKRYFFIQDSLESIIEIAKAQLQNRGITLQLHIQKDIPQVYGYKNLLEQVLQILLANARDAFEERKIDNPVLDIHALRKNECIVLEVCDNAGGIASEVAEKIFNPYFTTKEPGKGTGLGLYIAKKIIQEEFRGEIVYSKKKQKSIFTISFPLKDKKCK